MILASEEINAAGGVKGRKIEVIIKDSQGNPEKAISFAKQLIEEEKVLAIVGPSTSGETMAIKNLAEEGKTILLSCAAAEGIVNPVAKWVFKTPQKDSYAVVKIFQQMKKMGISRIGVLSSNTGFGKAGKEQIERLAPEYGIQIAVNEVYDKSATDLTAEVTKIKAANVQALLNWSIEPAQSIVIKNARQVGLTVPIFQSHGFANVQYAKAAGAAADGVIFPASRIVIADQLAPSHPQKAVVDAYRKAMDRRDAAGVLALVSRAYFDDSGTADPTDDVDYDRLAQQLPLTLQKVTAERLEIGVTQIAIEGDGATATVRLFFDNYYRIVTPRAEIPKRDSDVHLMKLRREDGGVWRITSGL